MGFFRHRVSGRPASPVEDFWQWWASDGKARFSAAAATGQWDGLPSDMEEQLAAVIRIWRGTQGRDTPPARSLR